MPLKYIGMILALVIILNLGALILSESGNFPQQVEDDLNTVAHFGIVQQEESWGFLNFVAAPFNYAQAVYRITIMSVDANNEIFGGGWRYLWWLLIIPVSGMIAYGMIVVFFSLFQRAV